MSQDDLIQEIEEDLQRQKAEKFWRAYGTYIVSAAIAIVAITGVIVAWKNYRYEKQAEATTQLIRILELDKLDQDKKIVELEKYALTFAGKPHATYAKLQEAALFLKSGQKENAIDLYDVIAKDSSVETIYRELADLMAVQAQMDDGDVAKLMARLEPLMADDNTWRYTAKEYGAHLALRAGDKAKAKKLFTDLTTDKKTPPALLQRATDMLQVVNAE